MVVDRRRLPLPTLLSHALVAMTIGLDNELEQRKAHKTTLGLKRGLPAEGPWLVSWSSWANLLRFVPPGGISLQDLRVAAMRAALIALTEIKVDAVASGASRRRPPGRLMRFSPIFPVRDLAAELAHYASLGFTSVAYEGAGDYGFANRDGVSLHMVADQDHDHEHRHGAAAYLYVSDADALYEQWSKPGFAGHTHRVTSTPYGMREGSHLDPDSNLVRFGSPTEE